MRTRKQLLADRRKKLATETKIENRDYFVRRIFRRHGVEVNRPDLECFRNPNGHTYISSFTKVGGCLVGIVEGCSGCARSQQAFNMINNGKTKNLPFMCGQPNVQKIWIVQPEELKIHKAQLSNPGLFKIAPLKPVYDSHGHLISGGPGIGIPPTPVSVDQEEGVPVGGFDIEEYVTSEDDLPGEARLMDPTDIAWVSQLLMNLEPGWGLAVTQAMNSGRLWVTPNHSVYIL